MTDLHGVMGQFPNAQSLMHAAHEIKTRGYIKTDAFSPFPIEGLHEALGGKRTKIPMIVFFSGLFGGTFAFSVETFANVVHYPLIIGGKPYYSWPAFIPITFELTVLFAAFSAAISMILLNRLPELYHPVFNIDNFRTASRDGFFLLIKSTDPSFDLEGSKQVLAKAGATQVYEVPN